MGTTEKFIFGKIKLRRETLTLDMRRKRKMKNIDIRLVVSDKKLTYRQIAAEMGITSEYLSRLMSKDLKPGMRERILNAIDRLENLEGVGL